jgi:hypothetical protein
LRELLPGLDLLESASFSDLFSTRACNCLARDGKSTWTSLASMTPLSFHWLPDVGAKTVEEILMVTINEWASSYLGRAEDHLAADEEPAHALAPIGGDQAAMSKEKAADMAPEPLAGLLGQTPDPHGDRRLLLALADRKGQTAHQIAKQINADARWRQSALGEMLPGLGLVESTTFYDCLGVRAANSLGRAGIRTLGSIASVTPAEIHELPNVGSGALEEVLAAVAAEWASAYLRHADGTPHGPLRVDSPELAGHLVTIGSWASAAHGANGSVEAIVTAAKSRGSLPKDVEHAMCQLETCNTATSADRPGPLAQAFETIEGHPGFLILKRRRLDEGKPTPFDDLAAEQGVSYQRVQQIFARIRALLAQQMRNGDWPIRIAVDEVRRRLGSVARPGELDEVFAALDHSGEALPPHMPHRRALLLWLGDYRLTEEWVLGPDIELLTKVILSSFADSGSASLDAANRQLSLLGIREELQLPWILSQRGFRIIDGELVEESSA